MSRTQTIEKTLFKFDELSDASKERARDWWRESEANDFDDITDRDDFEACAKILGIEFDTHPVKLMGGGTRYESKIWYRGFSSQGDGASFEGRYSYAKGCAKAIRAHAPQDTELHRIADELTALQRKHFYRIEARMTQGPGSNFYSHSGTMSVASYLNGDDAPRAIEDEMRDLMRAFADWIYRQLRLSYEYRMSDESVDESIHINEYEFDEDGRIA